VHLAWGHLAVHLLDGRGHGILLVGVATVRLGDHLRARMRSGIWWRARLAHASDGLWRLQLLRMHSAGGSGCHIWLRHGLLMWSFPVVVEVLGSMGASLSKLLVVLGSLGGLTEYVVRAARLRAIVVGRARDLLPGSDDVPIAATRPYVIRSEVDHGQRSRRRQGDRVHAWPMSIKTWPIAVDDLTLGHW